MALIHRAANGLEQELMQRKEMHEYMARQETSKNQEKVRCNRIRAIIALIICAALMAVVLLNREIAQAVRLGVAGFVGNIGDWLMEGRPFVIQLEEVGAPAKFPFLIEVAIVAVRTILGAMMVVLGFCVVVLSVVIGWLCWGLVYAIPVIGALCALAGMFDWYGNLEAKDFENGEDERIRAGLEGEKKALEIVASGLDNRCHVFSNLIIPYDGETSETDMIAVTPSGVTIIEVKNYKGAIIGDLSDHDLIHRRTLRNGKHEDSDFYNPVKQVGTHVHRLAGYLKENGIPVYVNSCVLFVNDEVQLNLTDREGISREKCPVFHGADIRKLHALVCSNSCRLSGGEVQAVTAALDRLIDGKQ